MVGVGVLSWRADSVATPSASSRLFAFEIPRTAPGFAGVGVGVGVSVGAGEVTCGVGKRGLPGKLMR